MKEEEESELYEFLVQACQQYGTTNEETYQCLHNAIDSIDKEEE